MDYNVLVNSINQIKKGASEYISNIIYGMIKVEQIVDVIKQDDFLIIIVQEPFRKRAFFCAKNKAGLSRMFECLPEDIYVEWLYKDDNEVDQYAQRAGLEQYALYIRFMQTYNGNYYEYSEPEKRDILSELYDETFGEYPSEKDAEELYELSVRIFDANCDEVFTVDEWKRRIERKEVLIYRECGEIITVYAWRLEGKKLNSNLAVNLGPANYLYNMQRRVFTQLWRRGIRTNYYWINTANAPALNRLSVINKSFIEGEERIYNAIYVKRKGSCEMEREKHAGIKV